ncbi:nuclear cap-binding protein subunit 2 [Nematocida displodere]|uniref:Nuclear cap-binding protein subunit 2 n=1 Tax=Nematocida displodere TaxID=1805483 RepID=A0A177EIB3_9MICR|nr:nuclear cap-binding protein subunit 2 [Nematocida displodere]
MSSIFAVSDFLKEDEIKSRYMDKTYTGTDDDYKQELVVSGTVYVGNLSSGTKEEQLHLLYSQTGKVERVIMGLDAKRQVPCGFCFVEFADLVQPMIARRSFTEYRLDKKCLFVDLDTGFAENRQFGRGIAGGQAREDPENKRKRRRQG